MQNNIFQSVLFINELYHNPFGGFSDANKRIIIRNLAYYSRNNESIYQFSRMCKNIHTQSNVPFPIRNKHIAEGSGRKRCIFATDEDNKVLAYYIINLDNGLYDFEILHANYKHNSDVEEWIIAKFELRLNIFNKTSSKYYLERL